MSFLTKTLKDALAKVNALPVWKKPAPVKMVTIPESVYLELRDDARAFELWYLDEHERVRRLLDQVRALEEELRKC